MKNCEVNRTLSPGRIMSTLADSRKDLIVKLDGGQAPPSPGNNQYVTIFKK